MSLILACPVHLSHPLSEDLDFPSPVATLCYWTVNRLKLRFAETFSRWLVYPRPASTTERVFALNPPVSDSADYEDSALSEHCVTSPLPNSHAPVTFVGDDDEQHPKSCALSCFVSCNGVTYNFCFNLTYSKVEMEVDHVAPQSLCLSPSFHLQGSQLKITKSDALP